MQKFKQTSPSTGTTSAHDEAKPDSGFIGQSARAVAIHCLLPTPAPANLVERFKRLFNASYHESEEACAVRQVRAKKPYFEDAKLPYDTLLHSEKSTPPHREQDGVFAHIMHHAKTMAHSGMSLCQVRDVNYSSEPHQFGYRDAGGKCRTTTNEAMANAARKAHPKTPPR